jgi:hypothetical protein
MGVIPYEISAYYIFDRGYYDLNSLFHINEISSYFVIRPKSRMRYKVIKDNNTKHNKGGILSDQEIELTAYVSNKYPKKLRRVVCYAKTLKRTFIYFTNNFEISAEQVALIYKYHCKWSSFSKG